MDRECKQISSSSLAVQENTCSRWKDIQDYVRDFLRWGEFRMQFKQSRIYDMESDTARSNLGFSTYCPTMGKPLDNPNSILATVTRIIIS